MSSEKPNGFLTRQGFSILVQNSSDIKKELGTRRFRRFT